MIKIFPLLLVLWMSFSCLAQDDKEISAESHAYHEMVKRNTIPPYSIEKVRILIGALKPVDNADGWTSTEAISTKTYGSLSLREKFTYHMIHGETYSQNCDGIPPIPDEQKKLFGYLSDPFGEYEWAERQKKFFKDNKDSVVALMSESIRRSHHIGLNYKKVIVDINATEMIPLLISMYNEKKIDHDILTVLMLLMSKNKYPVFINSLSWQKLYGDPKSNRRGYLDFNTANEQLILQRAADFYKGLAAEEERVFIRIPDLSRGITTPPYSLQKVRQLILKMQNHALSDSSYLALSLREKFTYNTIHPESYRQNCSAYFEIDKSGGRIAAELPDVYGEFYWSDRQIKFFAENRDSVITWITETVGQTHDIGLNYKALILLINAREMIPFLKSNYLLKGDNYTLTLLMLLMKQGAYAPFMNTAIYKESYEGSRSSRHTFIEYSKPNEYGILQQATNYYDGVAK